MLNLFGWASSKGMVAVPDLSTLTYTDAITLLQSSGLNYTNNGSVSTSNSNLNNRIATQSIAAGTLVDYETNIGFTYYNYVPAPTPPAPTPPAPTPPAPTPPAPTPPAPTPPAPTPPAPTPSTDPVYGNCYSEYRAACCGVVTICVDLNIYSPTYGKENYQPCSNGGGPCAPTPPAPTPPAPTPPAPTPPAPTPPAPTPPAPTPPAPTPPAPVYSFSTTTYGVKCISGNTFIRLAPGTGLEQIDLLTGQKYLIDENNQIIAKQAKDINVGDEVMTVQYSEIDQSAPDYQMFEWSSESLTFVSNSTTIITDIEESNKIQTVYFNGDNSAQFTLEHPILTNKTFNGVSSWKFAMVAELEVGDTIVKYNSQTGLYDNVIISSIDIVENSDPVYTFSAEPGDIIVAGDIITHNK